ncbi:MAG: DUF4012 domain-containing protein [Anaerolineae bacterium]
MSSNPNVQPAETNDPNAPLTATPLDRRRRRRSHRPAWYRRLRRRLGHQLRWTRLLLMLLAIVAVVTVGVIAISLDSLKRVEGSLESFERVVNSLSNRPGTDLTLTDFNRLDSSVSDLVSTLSATRARLGFLQVFGGITPQVNATFTSLNAAEELGTAARSILNGLKPTLFFLVSGDDSGTVVSQISSGERVVELLRLGRGQFTTASEHLDKAQTAIDNLNLSGVPSSVLLSVQQLIGYQTQLKQINSVLLNAPDFLTSALGITGDQNYLVLSQNNDELRPSGGYISTYGWLTVRNSRVTSYGYSPTTASSPNPPSADLAAQLNVPSWWLRYREPIYAAWDGSWYADFPSTARMSMWFYNTGGNPHTPIDGVIAIDITGFEYLLSIIGTVSVPEYNVTVNADNFREVIYDIRAYGEGEDPHKRFLAALYKEIFAEWQSASLDSSKNELLLSALLRALQEKHIMLYFDNEQLNDAVRVLGWSGAQEAAVNHDYLMVADANLGNKSNHSINRSLTYDVDIQPDGSVDGRATVAYDYSARVADSDPAVNPEYHGPLDYNALTQLFVPAGTTLHDVTNLQTTPTVVTNELNTEFISRFFVPYDSVQRYQFTYSTRPVVETLGAYHRYRLLVQKQAGTPTSALSVQIMLPDGAKFITSTPDPAANYTLDRQILEFRPDLSTDRWIEVIYQ